MVEADEIVLSFPSGLSDWGRRQVLTDRFRGYFRRVLDAPAVGEFLDVGCCGDSLDLTFRVEAVAGGETVGPDTRVRFVERDGDVAGGWRVQSAAGPTES